MHTIADTARAAHSPRAFALVAALATLGPAVRGQICLEAYSPLATRAGGSAVAWTDLDRDGCLDLVTLDGQPDAARLRIQRGLGHGAYAAPVVERAGPGATVLASADLDGDGFPDLVTNGHDWGFLSVFLNHGGGSLAPRVDYDLGLGDADCIACADLDGDGDVDIAIGNIDTGRLRLLRNHGDGTFTLVWNTLFDGPVRDLVARDFDGDGDIDLAAVTDPATVEIFLNLGAGQFANPIPIQTSLFDGLRLACADLDGDGALDLALLCDTGQDSRIEVLRNVGGGMFAAAGEFSLGSAVHASTLLAADVDGDSRADLVATDPAGELFVLGNRGSLQFEVVGPQAAAGGANATASADLDGDGKQELAIVSDSAVWILRGSGGWRLSQTSMLPSSSLQTRVVCTDLDADGDADLAVLDATVWGGPLGRVEVLRNDRSGSFATSQRCTVGRYPIALCAQDLDGDGSVDLAVANAGGFLPGPSGSVSLLSNLGNGTFGPEVRLALDAYPTAIVSADLDQDGDADLAVLVLGPVPWSQGSVVVFRNQGHAAFGAPVRFPAGIHPEQLVTADLDGDGLPDLVVRNAGAVGFERDVTLLHNLGNATFAVWGTLGAGLNPMQIACDDVDRDGKPDLVLAGQLHVVDVLINTGAGTFTGPISSTTGSLPGPLAIVDLDGDGLPELVVSQAGQNTLSVLHDAGAGHFVEDREYAAGVSPGDVLGADLDADGDLDLVCTSVGGLRILRNCSVQGASFCAGDGSAGACPCNNLGTSGRGCENSAGTGGARLSATGSASLGQDSLTLRSEGELAGSTSVLLQGTMRTPATAFGDGLRCVGGTLTRLYVRPALGGVMLVPEAGDASISLRSAALGDAIGAGSTRLYQAYYRDPSLGFCPAPLGGPWNVSSGLIVHWIH